MQTNRVTSLELQINREFSETEPLKSILQVLAFSKWTGFQPLAIPRQTRETYRVSLAGCLPILICLATIAEQIVFGLEFAKALFVDRSRMTDILVALGYYASSFISVIIVPRIGVVFKSSLESALNSLSTACALLRQDKGAKTKWPPWLTLSVACCLMVTFEFMRMWYFARKEFERLKSSMFTLGTGHVAVLAIVYGFDLFYSFLASWISLVQLHVICRTLVNCFTHFRQVIAEELQPSRFKLQFSARESLPSTGRIQNFQDVSLNLSKAVIAIDAFFGLSLFLLLSCRLMVLLGAVHQFSQRAPSMVCVSLYEVVEIASSMRIAMINMAEIIFAIWLGDSVSTAVEKLKQEVMNIKIPISTDNLAGSHLEWLQNHVNAIKGDITAFGLFPINRRIVPPILGALVTYFLIIVQFSKEESRSSIN